MGWRDGSEVKKYSVLSNLPDYPGSVHSTHIGGLTVVCFSGSMGSNL